MSTMAIREDEEGPHSTSDERSEKGGILVTAAKAIGSAAGKIASLGRSERAPETEGQAQRGPIGAKFQPSQKHRLPRKLKKAQKKLAQQKG